MSPGDQDERQQDFLGALKALGGTAGNGRMRDLLGWEEAEYETVRAAVLAEKELREGQGLDPVPFLLRKAGQNFCNTSPLDMKRLMGDQDNIGENLRSYIQAFTPEVRDIFERFEFHLQVDRLEKAGLLYMVSERFAQIDLHPETVSNAVMGWCSRS